MQRLLVRVSWDHRGRVTAPTRWDLMAVLRVSTSMVLAVRPVCCAKQSRHAGSGYAGRLLMYKLHKSVKTSGAKLCKLLTLRANQCLSCATQLKRVPESVTLRSQCDVSIAVRLVHARRCSTRLFQNRPSFTDVRRAAHLTNLMRTRSWAWPTAIIPTRLGSWTRVLCAGFPCRHALKTSDLQHRLGPALRRSVYLGLRWNERRYITLSLFPFPFRFLEDAVRHTYLSSTLSFISASLRRPQLNIPSFVFQSLSHLAALELGVACVDVWSSSHKPSLHLLCLASAIVRLTFTVRTSSPFGKGNIEVRYTGTSKQRIGAFTYTARRLPTH